MSALRLHRQEPTTLVWVGGRHRRVSHLPEAQTRPSSEGRVGQKSFGVVRPERDRIRDEGRADICLETLSSVKTLDSEATAGIEPAMKVLQIDGSICEPRGENRGNSLKSRL
jgi:hypothetical protein